MKLWLFILALLIQPSLFAMDSIKVMDTEGKLVVIGFDKLAEALKIEFNKKHLRNSKSEPVRNSLIISNPEIEIDGVWYPFEESEDGVKANICRTFGFDEQIKVEVQRSVTDRAVSVILVDRKGRYVRRSHDEWVVNSINCALP